MMGLYILALCRIVVGLVFALSSGGKVFKLREFQQAILRFRLLPTQLTLPAALWFLGSEIAVVVLMILGGPFLLPGFVLALLLLILFSGALASVLSRGISTSCSCFGSSKRPISQADIWRNLGFLLCALGGSTVSIWIPKTQLALNVAEWLLAGLGAAVFVLMGMQAGVLFQLFQHKERSS